MEPSQTNTEQHRMIDSLLGLSADEIQARLQQIGQDDPAMRSFAEHRLGLRRSDDQESTEPFRGKLPNFDSQRLLYALRCGLPIGAVAFTLFFFIDYSGSRWINEPDHLLYNTHVLTIAVLLVTSLGVWVRQSPGMAYCRTLEFASVAAAMVFLGTYQYCELRDYVGILTGNPHFDEGLLENLGDAFALRWGLFLLLYILFIPHTSTVSTNSFISAWRNLIRCIGIAVVLGAVPLVLTWIFFSRHGQLKYVQSVTDEIALWLATSAATAICAQFVFERAFRGERVAGAWAIIEEVGAGGIGVVYKAKHRVFGQVVALKIQRRRVKWMTTEAMAMAQLSHPNLARIYYYDGGFARMPYIVMEWIPGTTLNHLMTNHYDDLKTGGLRMEAARVVYLLRQVCAGVHEAHLAGIIHRDLTPANIMVCYFAGHADFVKVLDFGIAGNTLGSNALGSPASRDYIVGTRPFMSPEQRRGVPLDVRSDLYSIGAVAYYLLTGEHLPNLNDPTDQNTPSESPDPLPNLRELDCPDDLRAVIVRCTRFSPAARFTGAADLLQALESLECAGDWDQKLADRWWESRSL